MYNKWFNHCPYSLVLHTALCARVRACVCVCVEAKFLLFVENRQTQDAKLPAQTVYIAFLNTLWNCVVLCCCCSCIVQHETKQKTSNNNNNNNYEENKGSAIEMASKHARSFLKCIRSKKLPFFFRFLHMQSGSAATEHFSCQIVVEYCGRAMQNEFQENIR